jgi:hyperosmotically inducible periplasmic protein
MNRARQAVAVVLLSIGILVTSAAWVLAKTPVGQQTAAPDNTKTNQRDRSDNAVTADQQKENRSDRELARQIRRAIVKDKSLSTYAHNVKIITQDGQVTLKGPVRSEDEKRTIEAKATEVAGENKVTSQLNVKTQQ